MTRPTSHPGSTRPAPLAPPEFAGDLAELLRLGLNGMTLPMPHFGRWLDRLEVRP